MKLLLTLFTLLFALNANALSFTERMSVQNKPTVTEASQKSTLTAEDKALTDCQAQYPNNGQLVQALLIIIALMAIAIYVQGKKINKLVAAAEEE